MQEFQYSLDMKKNIYIYIPVFKKQGYEFLFRLVVYKTRSGFLLYFHVLTIYFQD